VVRNEQSSLELIEVMLLSHWCWSPTLGGDVLQSFGLLITFPLTNTIIIYIFFDRLYYCYIKSYCDGIVIFRKDHEFQSRDTKPPTNLTSTFSVGVMSRYLLLIKK
jgi:hypothetical protein